MIHKRRQTLPDLRGRFLFFLDFGYIWSIPISSISTTNQKGERA